MSRAEQRAVARLEIRDWVMIRCAYGQKSQLGLFAGACVGVGRVGSVVVVVHGRS